MSKTNFTKVEKAIDEGLQQMIINHLLDLADATASEKEDQALTVEQKNVLIQALSRNLKKLSKLNQESFQKLSPLKKELKKLMLSQGSLTPEEWKKIKEIKEKIEVYRKEIAEVIPQISDDQIIEEERIKHINKRFNIKENWLPLK
ncbi:MAG: hypothetical protein ACSNEK_08685 [Parachlamydiaceae bacterium]